MFRSREGKNSIEEQLTQLSENLGGRGKKKGETETKDVGLHCYCCCRATGIEPLCLDCWPWHHKQEGRLFLPHLFFGITKSWCTIKIFNMLYSTSYADPGHKNEE
jgi:hypothetical protein